jgi:multisubunit Na+/H+ antiporter MnhF subunit
VTSAKAAANSPAAVARVVDRKRASARVVAVNPVDSAVVVAVAATANASVG